MNDAGRNVLNALSIEYISMYCETNNLSLVIEDGKIATAIKETEEMK